MIHFKYRTNSKGGEGKEGEGDIQFGGEENRIYIREDHLENPWV